MPQFTFFACKQDYKKMLEMYCAIKWPGDFDKNDNFKVNVFRKGYLLQNVFWKDSIEVFKDGEWCENIIRENIKLYD